MAARATLRGTGYSGDRLAWDGHRDIAGPAVLFRDGPPGGYLDDPLGARVGGPGPRARGRFWRAGNGGVLCRAHPRRPVGASTWRTLARRRARGGRARGAGRRQHGHHDGVAATSHGLENFRASVCARQACVCTGAWGATLSGEVFGASASASRRRRLTPSSSPWPPNARTRPSFIVEALTALLASVIVAVHRRLVAHSSL